MTTATAITTEALKELQAFALANYVAGGHWAYETHSLADYAQHFDWDGDLETAKVNLRGWWVIALEQDEDAHGGFEDVERDTWEDLGGEW